MAAARAFVVGRSDVRRHRVLGPEGTDRAVSMKLWIWSDLYPEMQNPTSVDRTPEADIITCAGDLHLADQLGQRAQSPLERYRLPIVTSDLCLHSQELGLARSLSRCCRLGESAQQAPKES